jgi:hypothetical protein
MPPGQPPIGASRGNPGRNRFGKLAAIRLVQVALLIGGLGCNLLECGNRSSSGSRPWSATIFARANSSPPTGVIS